MEFGKKRHNEAGIDADVKDVMKGPCNITVCEWRLEAIVDRICRCSSRRRHAFVEDISIVRTSAQI